MSDDPPLCPVITATQTIQSGLVVRWYRGMTGYQNQGAVLSVSRDGVMIHGDVFLHDLPEAWIGDAREAFADLRAGRVHKVIDLATHKHDGFLGPLVPVG